MHLVAIAALEDRSSDSLHPLAADLGTTPYELRLLLNAGLPAVVLATVDETKARAAVAAISRHGHAAVCIERRHATRSEQMVSMREPRFLPTGLSADAESNELLPYHDIAVLLRATHRSTIQTSQTIKERKLRPVMAIATGGLVLSKTVSRSVSSTSAEIESVLYLFCHSARTPWILKERHANYTALGSDLQPTSFANFTTTVGKLRQLAPDAIYDERLTSARPMRGVADGIDATDLFANLLSSHLRTSLSRTGSNNTG